MIPSPVCCVFFDAVGTLIYADPPVRAAYASAASRFGLTLDEATIGRRFAAAFHTHYAGTTGDDDCATSEEIERCRWRATVDEVFHEVAPCEALFEQLWDHFARPTNWRLFDDVAECLRRLGDRGLSLGVASNFDQRLIEICRGLSPLDGCDHYFVSSQIGFRKPACKFFRAIERATGLEPQQLMLIGDDWDADYRAAAAAGWHAVHLNRDSNVAASSCIRSLAHLDSALILPALCPGCRQKL
jgi:putative hydrolase of the HAD superfamily